MFKEYDIVTIYRPKKLEKSYKQEDLGKAFLEKLAKQSDIIFER